jgi:hypothetical protein
LDKEPSGAMVRTLVLIAITACLKTMECAEPYLVEEQIKKWDSRSTVH